MIAGLVNGPISAETVSESAAGMVAEGREYAAWHPNVVIKVPCTPAGLEAVCPSLRAREIRCKRDPRLQREPSAMLAALAGAFLVSPFIGRIDDISHDGTEVISEIAGIFDQDPDVHTQILAASLRHPRHIIEAALAGAHIATCPFNVLKKAIRHPLTDRGMASFLADWRAREAAMALAAAPAAN